MMVGPHLRELDADRHSGSLRRGQLPATPSQCPLRRFPPTSRADQLGRRLRERLDALGPAPRAELLRVLVLPDFERADQIGAYWGNPKTRTFAELLVDCEEDRTLRAVLVGMLREAERAR
jgi:hypothetical protein